MGKLALFERKVTLGRSVTLRLIRGEDVTGTITELEDDYVSIDVGERVVTIFEDILAGWDIHQQHTDTLSNPEKEGNEGSDFAAKRPHREITAPVLDPRVEQRRTVIDATYSEAIKRASLRAPEPDFTFPENEFLVNSQEIKREWDRARNQYEYALKVREESRLLNIVGQVLSPLAEKHRGPAIHALLGSMLLRLGRNAEAVNHFRIAACTSRSPLHWYGLACAASGSVAECYALRHYFLTNSPTVFDDTWLRYLATSLEYGDSAGMITVFSRAFPPEEKEEISTLLIRSLIYIFTKLNEIDFARHLASILLEGESSPPDEWQVLLRKLLPNGSPKHQ